jgi:hypothetical protein
MSRFSALQLTLIALSICAEAQAEKHVALVGTQFAVYDACMLKPRDTPCVGINVAQRLAEQSFAV